MHSNRRHSTRAIRTASGSLTVLIPCGILIAVVGIGAFALDISHNVNVRTELQNASDAAALAGAHELLDSSTQNNAEPTALLVAESNTADGKPVSNSTEGASVEVQTNQTLVPTQQSCSVTGNMQIQNMFAKLVGHNTDAIIAKSNALAARSITGVGPNIAFPLAVSIDTTNGGQQALFTKNIGDEVRFEINSQQVKNAAWTSFDLPNTNASWLNNAIDSLLGLQSTPANIPSSQIGDDLNMSNGVASQKDLAKEPRLSALQNQKNMVIPLMAGDPPYNQARPLVGYLTIKVKDVIINRSGEVETIVAEITKGIVNRAMPGTVGSTTSAAVNAGINRISAGTVKLVNDDIAMNGLPNTTEVVATSSGK